MNAEPQCPRCAGNCEHVGSACDAGLCGAAAAVAAVSVVALESVGSSNSQVLFVTA